MVTGTALAPAAAEKAGNQEPVAQVDVFPRVGSGILGLVGEGGQIAGAVAIDGLAEGHRVARSELKLKNPIEKGWERTLVPISEQEAERLKGAVLDHVLLKGMGHSATSEALDTPVNFVVEGTFYNARVSDLAGVRPVARV